MNLLWVTHLTSGLLMIALPVGLAIFLIHRFKLGWGVWWVGAVAFIASQIGHIPFNAFVGVMFERSWLPVPPKEYALVFSAIFLGLSAGLWEGWFRYIAYRWWAKQARSWHNGIVLGAGHGGMEAILLGALSLYTFIQITYLSGKDLTAFFPADQVQLARQQLASYWDLAWYMPLYAPLERLFAIFLHIAASILVLQAFTRRSLVWVWLGVGWHALVDGVAVYLMGIWRSFSWQVPAVETVLGLAAIISLAIIFLLKQPEPVNQIDLPPLATIDIHSLPVVEVTPENLEKSRFSG